MLPASQSSSKWLKGTLGETGRDTGCVGTFGSESVSPTSVKICDPRFLSLGRADFAGVDSSPFDDMFSVVFAGVHSACRKFDHSPEGGCSGPGNASPGGRVGFLVRHELGSPLLRLFPCRTGV